MPKGNRRKGKSDRARKRYEEASHSSDEESINENASVFSEMSENRSSEDGSEEVEDVSQQEIFEDKFTEAVDGLTQKSAQGRTNCFEAIAKAFSKKCIPDFVSERFLSITDAIDRSLRKGKSEEQAKAATVAALLSIQLEGGNPGQEIAKNLNPVLSVIATDKSVAFLARAKCCSSLALITFLADDEGDLLELMHQFKTIFCGSCLKGDGSIPQISAEEAALHAAALSSWALLLTLLPSSNIMSIVGNNNIKHLPSLYQIMGLLQSPHLDVRISAGEALAVIFETGRTCDTRFAKGFTLKFVEILRQLATDSNKFRAKKERKVQRATFRDILHFIEHGEYSTQQIRFGQEVLILDTWRRKKQYYELCNILGPAINMYLSENELVRDVFQLGSKVIIDSNNQLSKQSKIERHLLNAANFKARTISRNKYRDKRSDF